MKEIIRYQLLFEGRLEDVKKQYPDLPSELIDALSENDPSGNNKYLNWMSKQLYKIATRNGTTSDEINKLVSGKYGRASESYFRKLGELIETVNLFHKHNDRLTPERVYEAYEGGGIIFSNPTIVKLGKKMDPKITEYDNYREVDVLGIWEPKNINTYDNPKQLSTIINYIIDKYPSKSEVVDVTKKESTVIFDDENIKIIAPHSHRSSCMFGVDTKWCTTSKGNDTHFKTYTSKNNILIYFIFKKPLPENQLYIAAGWSIRSVDYPAPFKKLALWGHLNKKNFRWYKENDEETNLGLALLKAYCELRDMDFNQVKDSINKYIKSKDERSKISKFIRPSNVK